MLVKGKGSSRKGTGCHLNLQVVWGNIAEEVSRGQQCFTKLVWPSPKFTLHVAVLVVGLSTAQFKGSAAGYLRPELMKSMTPF